MVTSKDIINYFKKNPHFLSLVCEKLLLDEVLAGECSSTEFFLESLKEAQKEMLVQYHEKRIKKLNKET